MNIINDQAGLDSGILEMGDVIEFATKLNRCSRVSSVMLMHLVEISRISFKFYHLKSQVAHYFHF